MAQDIRAFAITVPPGTLKAAPQVTKLSMPSRVVTEVRVRVPPGPRGEVGWALGAAGQPVLPFDAGSWMVADDQEVTWPLDVAIDGSAWQFFAYSTGAYSHTLYVTFLLVLPRTAAFGAAGAASSLIGTAV